MLDLDSPLWDQWTVPAGSGRCVADWLRKIRTGPGEDCDGPAFIQESVVYSAAYAAVPHLLAVAERRPPDQRVGPLALIGRVAAWGNRFSAPPLLQDDFQDALERSPALILKSLKEIPPDEGGKAYPGDEAIFLLQALAAVCGWRQEGKRLGKLADGRVDGTCPGCNRSLTAEFNDQGLIVRLKHPAPPVPWQPKAVPEPPPTAAIEAAPPEEFRRTPASCWLARVAEEAGRPKLARRIRHLYGTATCPACERSFELMSHLT